MCFYFSPRPTPFHPNIRHEALILCSLSSTVNTQLRDCFWWDRRAFMLCLALPRILRTRANQTPESLFSFSCELWWLSWKANAKADSESWDSNFGVVTTNFELLINCIVVALKWLPRQQSNNSKPNLSQVWSESQMKWKNFNGKKSFYWKFMKIEFREFQELVFSFVPKSIEFQEIQSSLQVTFARKSRFTFDWSWHNLKLQSFVKVKGQFKDMIRFKSLSKLPVRNLKKTLKSEV